MPRKLSILALALSLLVCWAVVAFAAPEPKSDHKKTKLGKYLTAKEAYEMYKKAPDKVKIIDVRTKAEFQYVGNTGIAPNIPTYFMGPTWDSKKNRWKRMKNDKFLETVKAKYKADEPIIVMCRSGKRSAKAVNMLADAGFKDVYNLVDGFEGDKAKEGPNKGHRTVNGWKNSGNPYTYKQDESLIWNPAK